MISKRLSILAFLFAVIMAVPFGMSAAGNPDSGEKEENLDVKEIIFEHLGDGYGWEVPFSHTDRIPLPVIVRAQDGNWFCFSSAGLTEKEEVAGKDGKTETHVVPVVKTIERDGKTYRFVLAQISSHKDKVVEIFDPATDEQKLVCIL